MKSANIGPWSRLRRSVQDLGSLFVFGAVIASVVAWLPPLDSEGPRVGREQQSEDLAGGGIMVRSQVLHIWLPEPLADPSACEVRPDAVPSDRELRGILERRGYQDLFYAISYRIYQANADTADVSFIRFPYREPESLREFLAILAWRVGRPDRDWDGVFAGATVHILPAKVSRQELIQILRRIPIANGGKP